MCGKHCLRLYLFAGVDAFNNFISQQSVGDGNCTAEEFIDSARNVLATCTTSQMRAAAGCQVIGAPLGTKLITLNADTTNEQTYVKLQKAFGDCVDGFPLVLKAKYIVVTFEQVCFNFRVLLRLVFGCDALTRVVLHRMGRGLRRAILLR